MSMVVFRLFKKLKYIQMKDQLNLRVVNKNRSIYYYGLVMVNLIIISFIVDMHLAIQAASLARLQACH